MTTKRLAAARDELTAAHCDDEALLLLQVTNLLPRTVIDEALELLLQVTNLLPRTVIDEALTAAPGDELTAAHCDRRSAELLLQVTNHCLAL